jgi:CBS domain-containing protein
MLLTDGSVAGALRLPGRSPTAREQALSRRLPVRLRPKEAAMLVSDVLRVKGHNVVKIHATDCVELAVRRLAEHRIGALVVEDR